MSPTKKSKVFAFSTGQLALHVSSGLKVKVLGARRTKRMGMLIVASVTSKNGRGQLIVGKASSFTARTVAQGALALIG